MTRFAARLRCRLAVASIWAAGGPLTASVGVAPWTPGTTADELLAGADEALLNAEADTRGPAGSDATAGASDLSAAV